MLDKKKKITVAIFGLIFSILLLREFKEHIKILVGLSLAAMTAITLNQWAGGLTIIYTVAQIVCLAIDRWKLWKIHKNAS